MQVIFQGKNILIYKKDNLWHFVNGVDTEFISGNLFSVLQKGRESLNA